MVEDPSEVEPQTVVVPLEKSLQQRRQEMKDKFKKTKVFTRLELEELGEDVEDILFDDLKPDTITKYKLAEMGEFDNFFKKNRNKTLFECISDISSDDFNMEFERKNQLGHKVNKHQKLDTHFSNYRRRSTSRISSYQGSRVDFWKEH